MSLMKLLLATCCLVLLMSVVSMAQNSERIYGKITTVDGDELEGLIRWDKNEGNWVDILDGTKEIPRKYRREASKSSRKKYRDRDRRVKIFGIEIYDDDNGSWNYSKTAQSGIRFGHIQSLEVLDDESALLVLKSGEEVEFVGGSTDIGEDIREIVIEDDDEGELELIWDDIERIDFMSAKTNEKSNLGERLYGTLTTRRGQTFEGCVCWDTDELFTLDILDGEERSRKRKLKFGKIKAIERYSSSAASVFLKSGDEMVLRGSNDVNSGIRGIAILDANLGQVTVDWDEFDRLEFTEPKATADYDSFDGGKLLKGTVYDENGESFTGTIRWDNDEEYTWEILDGSYRDTEFDIEFGKIAMIEKESSRGSTVTLKDGREFRLRDSNDIDDDNKGIYISTDDGEEIVIDWEDFEKVEFK